jgi:hypothetical protein
MTPASEFLVHHGCAQALTRCRDGSGVQPRRGEAVVIRSARGLELGAVLCPAGDGAQQVAEGELLRRATADDHSRAEAGRRRGQALLEDLQRRIDGEQIPLLPLDVEFTLDGGRADVHVLCWGHAGLAPLQAELKARYDFAIYLLDRSRQPEEEHGCGHCGESGCGGGGCSSGGCSSGGCSSGNCSRGTMTADELTRRFAALREQMLAAQRLPLL